MYKRQGQDSVKFGKIRTLLNSRLFEIFPGEMVAELLIYYLGAIMIPKFIYISIVNHLYDELYFWGL